MNRTEYFGKIREQREALAKQFLDGSCLVISVKPVNNGPCGVTLDNAARLLVEGTHRIASDAEARAFHESMELKRAAGPDPLETARRQFGLIVGRKGGA